MPDTDPPRNLNVESFLPRLLHMAHILVDGDPDEKAHARLLDMLAGDETAEILSDDLPVLKNSAPYFNKLFAAALSCSDIVERAREDQRFMAKYGSAF